MPRPSARTWLLAGALAAAAGAAVFGRLHEYTHADAIVPVLVSLQRWTPFYWDQERYGMLVPLLAAPVSHPLWNLLLQRFLLAAGGLVAVALLARHVLSRHDWRLAGLLAAAALLVLAPGPWLFEWLFDQPYGLSLALALLGLAVAGREGAGPGRLGRLVLGALLVLLAHWVNAAAGLLLVPLAIARALVERGEEGEGGWRRLRLEAGLLGLGLLAGQGAVRLALLTGAARDPFVPGFLPASAWPAAWAALARAAWAVGAGWAAALAVVAAVGVAWLAAVPRLRPALPRLLLRSGALAAAAVSYALLAGALRWVAQNGSHWRYLAPAAVLVHVAALALVAEPLARSSAGAWAARASLALPLAAAVAALGWPSLARVRADLDHAAGAHTPAVLAARCDAVAGDYWTVWPAVWHAAWVRVERGDPAPLHGVSHRATPTLAGWPHAGARVCVPAGQEAAAGRWLAAYGLAGEVVRVALPRARGDQID